MLSEMRFFKNKFKYFAEISIEVNKIKVSRVNATTSEKTEAGFSVGPTKT